MVHYIATLLILATATTALPGIGLFDREPARPVGRVVRHVSPAPPVDAVKHFDKENWSGGDHEAEWGDEDGEEEWEEGSKPDLTKEDPVEEPLPVNNSPPVNNPPPANAVPAAQPPRNTPPAGCPSPEENPPPGNPAPANPPQANPPPPIKHKAKPPPGGNPPHLIQPDCPPPATVTVTVTRCHRFEPYVPQGTPPV